MHIPSLLWFPLAALLLIAYFWSWYYPAKYRRFNRLRVRIYQKMAENDLDSFALAERMGVNVGFVLNLLTNKQRVDAVAASGLYHAFPETSVEYWYHIDALV